MFFVVVAHSEDVDTDSALTEILDQCQDDLAGRTPKAGLVFAAIDYDHQTLLDGINEKWPGLQLIGCTTDGEISSKLGFQEDSVSLTLFGSDVIDITAGIGRNMGADLQQACQEAVKQALAKTDKEPSICITTPESLTLNGAECVATLQDTLGDGIPLFGATAGDQWVFERTKQFYGGEILSNSLPILLFSGPLKFSFGVASGWRPIGEPGVITKSAGTILHEIDHMQTLDFFRKYLGEEAEVSAEFPLVVLDSNDNIECLRAPFKMLEDQPGSVMFASVIPEGTRVQISVASRDEILKGCESSVQTALDTYPAGNDPEAAVCFSCAARKLILGSRTGEELNIIRSKMGDSVVVGGFYGFGEISPRIGDRRTSFHNETFVSLLLGT